MADGTLSGSGDKLATDELSTLNGADVTGFTPRLKVERVKAGFGSDNDHRDVDSAHPLPASDSVAQAKLDALHSDVGVAGDTPPSLATNATGLIGWLRKLVDTIAGTDFATATNQTSANTKLDALHGDNGGPGSSQPSLTNGGSGILGYLRNILDALRGTLTTDVSDRPARLLGRLTEGTYGYAAGTAAGNVDVPTGARLKRVTVIAGATVAATITILGGATITVPAGGAFDEQIPGDATGTSSTSEVVIGGTVQSYYVAWVS